MPTITNLDFSTFNIFPEDIQDKCHGLLIVALLTGLLASCSTSSLIENTATSGDVEKQLESEIESAISGKIAIEFPSEIKKVIQPVELDGDSMFTLLAAEFAGNAGDVATSLQYYREASRMIKDSRIASRAAGVALFGKNYEEALVALDLWQALEPSAPDLPRMYALSYLKLDQAEKAVPYIEEILSSTDGSSLEKAQAVKQLLIREASTETAYIVLQLLNKSEARNEHLLVLQSRYAAQLQKYEDSLALLDEVLRLDSSLHEVLVIKSRILTVLGQDEEASALIVRILKKEPDNKLLRLQLARMLVEQKQVGLAIKQYAILYENNPEDGDIALSLALLFIENNQLDDAIETLEYLIEIDKKISVANYYLGRIAQNQHDDKQSVVYYLKVISGDYVFDAKLRVGVLLAALGKPNEGLAKLEALADEQVSWVLRVRCYLAQGEILRSQNRFKEGVEMYSRALQYNRNDISLLYARGLMAEKVDRLDMTESDLLNVISQEPDNANALNALGYTLADRTPRYQEALSYIQRASELVPDDPAILDSLGWVSFRLGQMDKALEYLAKAFDLLEDAEIAAHYGEVLWLTNQKEKARKIWQKGKNDNANNSVLMETLNRINP